MILRGTTPANLPLLWNFPKRPFRSQPQYPLCGTGVVRSPGVFSHRIAGGGDNNGECVRLYSPELDDGGVMVPETRMCSHADGNTYVGASGYTYVGAG